MNKIPTLYMHYDCIAQSIPTLSARPKEPGFKSKGESYCRYYVSENKGLNKVTAYMGKQVQDGI